MANINETFGEAVRQVLDERRLSLRQGRLRTGIDIDTLSRMRQGEVPRIDKVIAFARGFGLDVNEWLGRAGYEPILASETTEQVLGAGLLELSREFGPIPVNFQGREKMTPDEARAYLAELRRQLEGERDASERS